MIPRWLRLVTVTAIAAAAAVAVVAWVAYLARREVLAVAPEGALQTHWFPDVRGVEDAESGEGVVAHLVVLNTSPLPARLAITAYFEDREPEAWEAWAAPGGVTESNTTMWPVPAGVRFGLEVTSDRPVFCQVTSGWTNTANDLSPAARTRSGEPVREAAKSSVAIRVLANRWYVADGVVLDAPDILWIRESETALVLNPGDEPATVEVGLFDGRLGRRRTVEVAARRLAVVPMDAWAPRNRGYGARFVSDRPVAVQWLREVRWHDRPGLMTWWSVPGVPVAGPGGEAWGEEP